MILSPPYPSYFSFLGLNIHYYSICVFLGVTVSFLAALFLSKRLNFDVNNAVLADFAPWLIIFGIIGARIYYVLLSLDFYLQNPLLILMVWTGGLSIHGAFIAGVLFGAFYLKNRGLKFFPYADIFALVLPLGQAIGRWGNFFNSEAFGVPASLNWPLALYVKEGFRPLGFQNVELFHPVFLYESVLDFLIFIILCFLAKKTANKFDGLIFFSYILFYSLIRFALEFLRLDTVYYLMNMPFPAVVSVLGVAIGLFGIIFRIKARVIF